MEEEVKNNRECRTATKFCQKVDNSKRTCEHARVGFLWWDSGTLSDTHGPVAALLIGWLGASDRSFGHMLITC